VPNDLAENENILYPNSNDTDQYILINNDDGSENDNDDET